MPVEPDVILDVKGLQCPLPVMKTKKAIDLMRQGEVIKVTANDAGSKTDIPALCRRLGLELISKTEDKGIITFLIRK